VKPLPRHDGIRTLAEVAKLAGISRYTIWRHFAAMAARDRNEGRDADWMCLAGRRKLVVNMGRLYVAHPALFDVEYATKDDWDEHEERIEHLESAVRESVKRINAVASRVRALATKKQA